MNGRFLVLLICIVIVEAHGNYRDAFLKHHNLKIADDTQATGHKTKAYGALQNLIEQIIRKEIEAERRIQQQQAEAAAAASQQVYLLPESQLEEKNLIKISDDKSKLNEELDFLSAFHRFG